MFSTDQAGTTSQVIVIISRPGNCRYINGSRSGEWGGRATVQLCFEWEGTKQ